MSRQWKFVVFGLFMLFHGGWAGAATVDELQKIISIQQAQIASLTTALDDVKKQLAVHGKSTDQKIAAAKTDLQQKINADHDTLQAKISTVDVRTTQVNDRITNVINGHEFVRVLKFTGPSGDAWISYDSGISITAPGGATNGYMIVHPGAIKYWRQNPESAKVIAAW
jgi:prefoldin subunit 5